MEVRKNDLRLNLRTCMLAVHTQIDELQLLMEVLDESLTFIRCMQMDKFH